MVAVPAPQKTKKPDVIPLAHANADRLFAVNAEEVRAEGKQKMRTASVMHDASQVESTYPLIFEWNDRFLRYAYLPARSGQSKGLVMNFHGHNAFLHLGPVKAWEHFDILAPWDTYGWNRQGSWFWGERGDDFVARMISDFMAGFREKHLGKPWFCIGSSMGGFGALYHGIRGRCDGIYVTAPQVDLRAKIIDYGQENRENPYGYLQGESLETAPDLLGLAESQETLPPLFLIQHQYDPVNYFADHGFRLLDIYNRKQAWYAVRVYPAIGHESDGSPKEAQLFFSHILEKSPPRQTSFRQD